MSKVKNYRYFFRGTKISEKTQSYIEKKLNTLNKFSGDELKMEVEIDKDKKGQFRVEVMAKTPYALYRAEETSASVEGSVDIVEDELKKQIIRDKDKRLTLKKRGAASIKKRKVVDKNARF